MGKHYTGDMEEELVLDTWVKLSRAKETVAKRLRHSLDQHKMTMTQFGVLEILHHIGPLPLKEIGEKILLSSSNLVTVVDNLEKQGLVIRRQNVNDRRSYIIHLTSLGRDAIRPIFKEHLNELVNSFSALNRAEKQTLGSLCKKLGIQ